MKILSTPRILGTAILGTASLISTASALNNDKKNVTNPPPQVKLTPLDIPKLVEKKLVIPEDLFNELLDDINNLSTILKALPQEINTTIAKKAFNEQIKTIKGNLPDLDKKEQQVENFIKHISEDKLKSILLASKNEFQELIEAYINALADENNKRKNDKGSSAAWNAWALDTKVLSQKALDTAPSGLFKEAWYTKIEKIAERIDKELSSGFPDEAKKWAINSVVKLSQLESKGSKEPKLYKTLLTLAEKGHIDSITVINELPLALRTEFVKAAFNEAKKALINNSPTLESKETNLQQLLNKLSNGGELKTTLLKTKSEYQDLIEAYINALADEKNKRKSTAEESASWNGWTLNTKLLNSSLDSAPPGLFKEAWHPKIERIIERINKELSDNAPHNAKQWTQGAVTALMLLELKSNNGESKIFQKITDLINSNPQTHFPSSHSMLYKGVVQEFLTNDPQKQSLLKSYENLVRKIIIDLPPVNKTQKETELHDSVIQAVIWLASAPVNRPQHIIDLQDQRLSKISKAKLEDIPDALIDFQERILNNTFPEQAKIVEAGKKYLIPIINTGFNGLLDEDSKNNEAGLRTILVTQGLYRDINISLTRTESLNKQCKLVFDRFQKVELKDEVAIKTYIDFMSHLYKGADIETSTIFAIGLNNQIQFSQKARAKAANPAELLKISNRELELLRGVNQFMENPTWRSELNHIESLFKTLSQDTLRNPFGRTHLSEGVDILGKVLYLPTADKERHKENRRFYQETLIPYLSSLLEGSKNLSKSERADFQKSFYEGLAPFFRVTDNPAEAEIPNGNLFILDDTLKSISRGCFDLNSKNKLEEFVHLTNTVTGKQGNYLWHNYMLVKMTNMQKDYLNVALKEANSLLDSKESNVQLVTVENLVSYRNFLKYMETGLDYSMVKTACTKEEQETTKDLIAAHLTTVSNMLLTKFEKAKVITEKSASSLEHTVNNDVFKASVNSVNELILSDKTLNKKCLEILDKRLETESDPRTRGMLYKTMAKLNPDKTQIFNCFKKAILTETSPITAQYIGEELGEMFFSELSEIQALKHSNRSNHYYGNDPAILAIVEKLSSTLSEYSIKVKSASKENIKADENKSASDFVLQAINISRGRNIEQFLKENLPQELATKLKNRKENEEIDPQIIKAFKTILSNSNSMLGGFAKSTSYNELAKRSSSSYRTLEDIDTTSKVKNGLGEIHKNLINLVEVNLRWFSTLDNTSHISATLVDMYNTTDASNEKINQLSERVFKGTDEKLSMYELLQDGLYSRYTWKYTENCREDKRNTKEDLEAIETTCRELRKRIEQAAATKDVKSRAILWRDLGLEISRLDPKLYSEVVRTPLANFNMKFLEEFIALAPSGQRREYINIALGRFGLRNQVSEVELRRVLGITEE